MRTVVITQARTGSTRLPGKIFKEVLGKTVLEYHLERLRDIKYADDIVIATTENPNDDKIEKFCREKKVACYRGSEDDVLHRFFWASLEYRADVIVRVTSDCPLIDPEVVDRVISAYREGGGEFDYVSNTLVRTYPRGLDCEVFPTGILEQAYQLAEEKADREHVTPFIYRHPEMYRLLNVPRILDVSQYRWTVDTPEDFELVRRMLEALYPHQPKFRIEDCLRLFEQNPELEKINRNIVQKALEE